MPSKFTEDEQTRILLVLALNGGHSERAATQLHDEGLDITSRQLRNLAHTDRYKQIRKTHAPAIEASLIEHYKDAGRRSLELQMIATEQAIDQATTYALERPNPDHYPDNEQGQAQYISDILAWKSRGLKDPAKTAQNAALASAVAIDKALVLDGRPNVIHHDATPEELMRKMAKTLGYDANSTAIEEPPDQALIPESSLANARESRSGAGSEGSNS